MSLDIIYDFTVKGIIVNTDEDLNDIRKRIIATVEEVLGENSLVDKIALHGYNHDSEITKEDVRILQEVKAGKTRVVQGSLSDE